MSSAPSDRATIFRLVLFGLIYNIVEGVLCVAAGVITGTVVLVGFGLDSGIEAAAAFAASRFLLGEITEEREERLSRIVGWTFLGLAAYVLIQSTFDLAHERDCSDDETNPRRGDFSWSGRGWSERRLPQ